MFKLVHLVEILFIASFAHGQYSSSSGQYPSTSSINSNTNLNIDELYGRKETARDEFDWKLFQITCADNQDNIVISPFSLKFSLALLYEGSSGKTEVEIRDVLKFPSRNETKKKFFNSLTSLRKPDEKNYIMNFGSRIYVDSTINVTQRYGSTANYYQTEVLKIDVSDAGKTAYEANNWIKNLTEGNIPNLVQEEDLQNAVIVLLNAIYFKGTWEYQFLTNESKTDVFYLNSEKKISTKYMIQTQTFKFYEAQTLDAKILRLPYKGDKYAMYIILPKSYNGLSNMISVSTASQIARNMLLVENSNVKVKMPLFKIEYLSKFIPILQQMGIRDLFEPSASLPLIAHGSYLRTKLQVSNILQKAGIDVNELGSTAYAATEVTLVNKFGSDDSVEDFIVDRPFVFFIEDETTMETLFMGKIENPSGEAVVENLNSQPPQQSIANSQPVYSQRPVSTPRPVLRPSTNQNQPRYQFSDWNRARDSTFG